HRAGGDARGVITAGEVGLLARLFGLNVEEIKRVVRSGRWDAAFLEERFEGAPDVLCVVNRLVFAGWKRRGDANLRGVSSGTDAVLFSDLSIPIRGHDPITERFRLLDVREGAERDGDELDGVELRAAAIGDDRERRM